MSTLNWASFWWGAIFALPSTLIFIYAYLLGNLSLRYPLFPRKSICIHHSHSPIRFQIYNSSSWIQQWKIVQNESAQCHPPEFSCPLHQSNIIPMNSAVHCINQMSSIWIQLSTASIKYHPYEFSCPLHQSNIIPMNSAVHCINQMSSIWILQSTASIKWHPHEFSCPLHQSNVIHLNSAVHCINRMSSIWIKLIPFVHPYL